jgi:hypothetical protein
VIPLLHPPQAGDESGGGVELKNSQSENLDRVSAVRFNL